MYKESDYTASFYALLDFRKKITLWIVNHEEIHAEEMESIRKHCEILNQEGFFHFDLMCNDIDLMEQIQSEFNKLLEK